MYFAAVVGNVNFFIEEKGKLKIINVDLHVVSIIAIFKNSDVIYSYRYF